jgi:hypothetical protein
MEVNCFTIQDNKFLFNYFSRFEPDEYDYFYGEFDLQEYKKGLEELNANGNCELWGKNCSLKVLNRKGLIDIIFLEGTNSIGLSGLDKKILPE